MEIVRQAPLISILIVNYRSYPELTSCLESLGRYPLHDVEVVVVDHASDPAASAQIVERFPWIQLLAVRGNPGFAAGVNRAAFAARGTYLLLLNPDCSVAEDVPHPLATWMDANASVGVCGALVREHDGTVQASARYFPGATTALAGRTSWLARVWPGNPWTVRNLVSPPSSGCPIAVDWVSGACMMISRRAFDAARGMDEGFFLYWEDADLCFRLRRLGWSTVYHPGVEVTHLTSRSSARAPVRSLVAFHRSAFRYYFKHAGTGARLAAPIVCLGLSARLAVKIASLGVTRLIALRDLKIAQQ